MKRLLVLSVLMVGAGASSASAQDGMYDYEISRALSDISWELFQQRLDRIYPVSVPYGRSYGGSYGGGYVGGGGYFPMFAPSPPSHHQIRDWKKRQFRIERNAAKRR